MTVQHLLGKGQVWFGLHMLTNMQLVKKKKNICEFEYKRVLPACTRLGPLSDGLQVFGGMSDYLKALRL